MVLQCPTRCLMSTPLLSHSHSPLIYLSVCDPMSMTIISLLINIFPFLLTFRLEGNLSSLMSGVWISGWDVEIGTVLGV